MLCGPSSSSPHRRATDNVGAHKCVAFEGDATPLPRTGLASAQRVQRRQLAAGGIVRGCRPRTRAVLSCTSHPRHAPRSQRGRPAAVVIQRGPCAEIPGRGMTIGWGWRSGSLSAIPHPSLCWAPTPRGVDSRHPGAQAHKGLVQFVHSGRPYTPEPQPEVRCGHTALLRR